MICSICGRVYRVFLPCPFCFPEFYSEDELPTLIRLADQRATKPAPLAESGAIPQS